MDFFLCKIDQFSSDFSLITWLEGVKYDYFKLFDDEYQFTLYYKKKYLGPVS